MSDTFQNTYSFSKELGYPSIALNSLSRALVSYRVLRFLFFVMDKQHGVIEIGPGSAQFANLAMSDGLHYEGIEVSKNFWIYQNLFLNDIYSKKNLIQGAMFKSYHWVDAIRKVNFLTSKSQRILVINHAIREMTPLSLTIYLHKLDCFNRIPFVICEGLGFSKYRENVSIMEKFGYVPIISKLTKELSVDLFVQQNLLQDFSFLKKRGKKIWIGSSLVEDFLQREDKIEMQEIFHLVNSYSRTANLISEDEIDMLDAKYLKHF